MTTSVIRTIFFVPLYRGYSRFGTQEKEMKLSRVQFFPFFLYDKGAHDELIRGLTIQPSQKFDNFFTEEV